MKKRILIDTIIISIISAIFHSIYGIMPNFLTSILFPVNESIWEHGKLIVLSFLILTVIDKYITKKNYNSANDNFLAAIICIILTYLIFTPIYLYVLKTEDNIAITLAIYTISIIISLIIREKYIKKLNGVNKNIGTIGFLALILLYGILTYYPLQLPLFYDYNKQLYGLNIRP